MNYYLKKRAMFPKHPTYNIHLYIIYRDTHYVTSSCEEKDAVAVFHEFCRAKAAGTFHAEDEIIVCQLICPKGHYRLTKEYYYIDQIKYRVYKKGLFGWWWNEKHEFTKCAPMDEKMSEALEKFVNEGVKHLNRIDDELIATC